MTYTIKKVENTNKNFIFYENKEYKDVDGNIVLIPIEIGIYNLENLNRQKEELQRELNKINEKISIIEKNSE
jgi:hypothetical protein